MANKKLLFGMLVMVLVFSFTVIGCDNGTTSNGNGGSLDGTWSLRAGGSGNYNVFTISGRNVTFGYGGDDFLRGTISYEGSSFTMSFTQSLVSDFPITLPVTITGTFDLSVNPHTLVMTDAPQQMAGMVGNNFTRQ